MGSGTALRLSVVGTLIGGLLVATGAGAKTPAAPLNAHGSVGQVYVTGVAPGAKLSLLDGRGHTVANRRANSLGGALFRGVNPGDGYHLWDLQNGSESGPLTVHTSDPTQWNADIYKQQIPANGYGYLTTRDG